MKNDDLIYYDFIPTERGKLRLEQKLSTPERKRLSSFIVPHLMIE